MILARLFLFSVLFAFLPSLAPGDAITVPGQMGGIWQTWNPSVLSAALPAGTVRPYWDNSSWSGGYLMNVGGCLASAANCGMLNAPENLPYLGAPSGGFYTDFSFAWNGGIDTATMQIQIAADSASSSLAWYDLSNPTAYHMLFSGNTTRGLSIDFTPSARYGLVFVDTAEGVTRTYFSQSELQVKDKNFQHFSVFEQSDGVYYLGIEDRPSDGSDLDYKDMIVKIATVSTPESPSLTLLAMGLVLLTLMQAGRWWF